MVALEKKQQDDEACGEIETAHPGYLGFQDTFYVGNLKGVERIYQQTFVHTYNKVALLRILTDRGTEYCGRVEQHDYQLYLIINDIDHTTTKARSPQTNEIREGFHKTIPTEFYQITFRKKLYLTLDELQKDLEEWMEYYNNDRTHQGLCVVGEHR